MINEMLSVQNNFYHACSEFGRFRTLGLFADGLDCFGKSNAAGFLNSMSSALCIGWAIDEIGKFPSALSNVVKTSKSVGVVSEEFFQTFRFMIDRSCALVISIGYASRLSNVTVLLADKLAPFVPWCDAISHANDLEKNVGGIMDGIRLEQNKAEAVRHIAMGAAAGAAAVGIVLSPATSFVVAIVAFTTSLFGYIKEQQARAGRV